MYFRPNQNPLSTTPIVAPRYRRHRVSCHKALSRILRSGISYKTKQQKDARCTAPFLNGPQRLSQPLSLKSDSSRLTQEGLSFLGRFPDPSSFSVSQAIQSEHETGLALFPKLGGKSFHPQKRIYQFTTHSQKELP